MYFITSIWSINKYPRQGVVTHMHCTDTCDRDQNLIRPILGLDRLIPARKLPWSLDFPLKFTLMAWLRVNYYVSGTSGWYTSPHMNCRWMFGPAYRPRCLPLLVIHCRAMLLKLYQTFICPYDIIQIQITSSHHIQAPLKPFLFVCYTNKLAVSSMPAVHPRYLWALLCCRYRCFYDWVSVLKSWI